MGHPEDDEAARSWDRFFAATSEEERKQEAMKRPEIAAAKAALDRLSADPLSRGDRLRQRLAELEYQWDLDEARAKGRVKGLREAVRRLCQTSDIEIDSLREQRLARATEQELSDLVDALVIDRRWPES